MRVHNRAIAKRVGLVVGLVLSALSLGLAVPASADQGVNITDASPYYVPNGVNANPGDTVTWTNRGSAAHNADCTGPPDCPVAMHINSGRLVHTNESESFTFQYSGTYRYHCDAHPNMIGTVVVSGNVQPPASSSGGSGGSGGSAGSSGSSGGGTSTSGGGSSSSGSKPATSGNRTTQPGGAIGAASQPDTVPADQQSVKDALVGVNLPRPNVVIHTAAAQGTPTWVVGVTAAALLLCALLFGFAWFGPPMRLRRGGRS